MTLEDLKPFCSTDEMRENLMNPWTRDGFTWATDGRVMIRVPAMDDVPENKSAPDTKTIWIFDKSTDPDFRELPQIPLNQELECPMCEGENPSGKFQCKSCGCKEVVCEKCGGTGRTTSSISVPLGNRLANNLYLIKLAKLPGVKIDFRDRENDMLPFAFIFDGGEGILMVMKGVR